MTYRTSDQSKTICVKKTPGCNNPACVNSAQSDPLRTSRKPGPLYPVRRIGSGVTPSAPGRIALGFAAVTDSFCFG